MRNIINEQYILKVFINLVSKNLNCSSFIHVSSLTSTILDLKKILVNVEITIDYD